MAIEVYCLGAIATSAYLLASASKYRESIFAQKEYMQFFAFCVIAWPLTVVICFFNWVKSSSSED